MASTCPFAVPNLLAAKQVTGIAAQVSTRPSHCPSLLLLQGFEGLHSCLGFGHGQLGELLHKEAAIMEPGLQGGLRPLQVFVSCLQPGMIGLHLLKSLFQDLVL